MITQPISESTLPMRTATGQCLTRLLLFVALALGGTCTLGCESAEETAHASEASGANQTSTGREASAQPREEKESPSKDSPSEDKDSPRDETDTISARPAQHTMDAEPVAAVGKGEESGTTSLPPAEDDGLDPTLKLVLDGRPGGTLPFELPEPWVYPPEPGQPPPPGKWAEVHEPRRDPLEVINTGERIAIVLRPGDVVVESEDGETWTAYQPDRPVVDLAPGDGYWWALSQLDRWGHPTRVARSRDQGRTWELRMTGEHLDPLPKLLQRDGRHLVLATGEHLLWSRDTREWHWIQPRVYGSISALWTDDPASTKKEPVWWVGGENSTVAHGHLEGEWTVELLPGLADDQAVYGFGRADTKGTLFAATERGLFARKGDDDTPWRRVESLGGRTYYGVRFIDDQVGVAYGASGEFAATVDGGDTWTRYTSRALAALGTSRDEMSAEALLDINWRYVEPIAGGLLLVGDDMLVVRVDSPHLQ